LNEIESALTGNFCLIGRATVIECNRSFCVHVILEHGLAGARLIAEINHWKLPVAPPGIVEFSTGGG
jgi:hypothetical protein